MSNVASIASRRPFAPSEETANEFGREIYGAGLDPSDPEACFTFLYSQFGERWREVMANLDASIYVAGQLYIDAEIAIRGGG